MFIRKKYVFFMILLLITSIVLTVQNLSIVEKIRENEDRLMYIGEKNKKSILKYFGYEDTVKSLSVDNAVKIQQINQQKDSNIVTANIEISGDILKIKEILQSIQQKENFNSLSRIELKKDNDNVVSAKVDVNFIKNK